MTTTNRDINEYIKAKKLVIGSKIVLKGAKRGDLQKVVRANNCPETINRDLKHYAKLSKLEIEDFNGDSKQLGEMCGKPFNILMIGVKK